MKEVELKLITNQQPAVKGIREVAAESQKLYTNNEKQQKRQVGLIEDIEDELGKLQEKQKKALTIEHIEKYNKKIAEAKKSLQEYNDAGVKMEKQGDSMMKSVGKWALTLGGVTAALGLLKEAFLKTQQGMIVFNMAGAATSKVLSNIVNGVGEWNKGVLEAMVLARQMRLLEVEDKRNSLARNKLLMEYNELYTEGIDARLSGEEKIKKLTAAKEKFIEATKDEIRDTQKMLKVAYDMWQNDPTDIKAEERVLNMANTIRHLQGELASGTRRLTRQITAEQERQLQEQADSLKRIHEWGDKLAEAFINDRLDQEKKFKELSLKLIEDYDKAQIESLIGADKLKAQKDFGLKQIELFRKQMQEMGTLTPEQEKMFVFMAEQVNRAFIEGMQKSKLGIKVKDLAFKSIEESVKEGQELRKSTLPDGEVSSDSIWNLLGIDPDSDIGKAAIDALKQSVDAVTSTMDEIYQKRVDDAERTRELAQDRLQEAQNELHAEIELYESGYASNVAGKKKEIEQLKKERDKALKDEQKAITAQRKFDSVMQTSSLVTASANIFKSLSKLGPAGIALAIGTIASMFTAFAVTKAQANKATKLAKGGHGMVSGRLHSEGGEAFLDHVEVEQGERWGVLSRSASRKYGKVFGNMVDSFNKEKLPIPKNGININNISVQNDGPNRRLDEVNNNLKSIRQKEEVSVIGNKTIYKKGNSIRIVKR